MFQLFLAAGLTLARGEVLSTVVGQVQAKPVTSREVRATGLMAQSLPNLNWPTKGLSEATDRVLLDTAIALEAEALGSAEIKADEVARAEKQVAHALEHNAEWKKLALEPGEIHEGLRRTLRARKFTRFREDAAAIPVPEGDLQRYYDENRARFKDLTFENARENIRSLLIHSQVDKRMQDWFEGLKRKYQVKSLIAEN